MINLSTGTRMAALVLCALFMVAAVPVTQAAEKKGPTLTPAVYKPVVEADKLIKAGTLEPVGPLLDQALAAAKTDFDRFQVAELRTQLALKQKNYPGAADAIEVSLALNQYTPQLHKDRLSTVCILRYQAKQTEAAITACNRVVAETGGNYDTHTFIAQLQYGLKHWTEAVTAIQAGLKIGGDRDESLLEMAFNCYINLKDKAGQRETLHRLVAVSASPDYWQRAVDLAEQSAPKKPRMDLDLDRIRLAAGLIDSDREYLDMAQIATEAGNFAEAQKILKKGIDAKVLGVGPNKARTSAMLAKAKTAVDDDLKGLPKFAKEAQASKDPKKDLALGQAYLDYDRYDDGLAAVKRALAKGADPGEGNLRLGQGLRGAGKNDEALVAFDAVPRTSPYREIAELWTLLIKSPVKK